MTKDQVEEVVAKEFEKWGNHREGFHNTETYCESDKKVLGVR